MSIHRQVHSGLVIHHIHLGGHVLLAPLSESHRCRWGDIFLLLVLGILLGGFLLSFEMESFVGYSGSVRWWSRFIFVR